MRTGSRRLPDMATSRDPRRGDSGRARQPTTPDEPASMLAARQLAAEASGAAVGRRPVRRTRAALPIRPLTNVCPLAS
jgi:hypothetical protein